MKFKRGICALLFACIFMISLRVPTNAAGGDGAEIRLQNENAMREGVKIYLDGEIISGDTVKISVLIDGNIGFCGGFFSLSYNEKCLSYAFCMAGDIPRSMTLTPSLGNSGRVYILLDGTRNFDSDGALVYLYFRINDDSADMLKFDIFGADTISLARIFCGEILPVACDFSGCSLAISRLPRVVGFQSRDRDIRIVCAGNDKYDILGIRVRAVYTESCKIEEYIFYGYAYEKLCGSEKLPRDYLAEYFFLSRFKIGNETVCLFILPFGYDGEKTVLGKEKTLLFYKGEYI